MTTIVTAIALFTAMAAAPVAADDGLLGDDGLGGDAIDIGTDDGVNVSLGGDSGVDVGVSPDDGVQVGAGGEEGGSVGVSPDGVEVGAGGDSTTIGPDGVGDAGPGTVDDVTSGVTDGSGGVGDVGSGVTDGTLGDAGAGSVPSGVASLVETPQGVEAADGLGSVSDLGDAGLLGGGLPTDGVPTNGVGDGLPSRDLPGALPSRDLSDTVPIDDVGDSVPGDGLPSSGLDPENAPIGDERAQVNVCDPLNPDSSDLPTDAVPGINDLPPSLTPSNLPTNLITNEAVVGIILGFLPGPCEVVHPNEPQIDPTDPPRDPDYTLEILRFSEYRGGFVYLVDYGGTLNQTSNEPGLSGTSGTLANPDAVTIDQVLVASDGKNEYGGELHFENLDRRTDSFQGRGVLIVLGGKAGAQGGCENLQEYQPDLSVESLEENPLGPCQFKPVGVPQLIGPSEIVGLLTGAGDVGGGEDLPVDPDGLPINPDELLSL